MSCSLATQQALWLRYLNADMGYGDLTITQFGKTCNKDYVRMKLSGKVDPNEKPSTIFGDNLGANQLTRNPVHSKRARHIHMRHGFSREHAEKGHVEFAWISTKENWADIQTKALPKQTHDYLARKMVYGCVNGNLHYYTGEPVIGTFKRQHRHNVSLPNNKKYYPRIPLELSDFDDEDDIRRLNLFARQREDRLLATEEFKDPECKALKAIVDNDNDKDIIDCGAIIDKEMKAFESMSFEIDRLLEHEFGVVD